MSATATERSSSRAGNGRPPAVRTDGLTKQYGRLLAVDGLSLEVPAGVVAGFIGPNGAGKTTTMGMLLGLVDPTAAVGRFSARAWSTPPPTWAASAR